MKISAHPNRLLSLGMLVFLLGACTQVQSAGPVNQEQYSYELPTSGDWQVKAARITSTDKGAHFTAQVFHRQKRAFYPTADLYLHIVDASGKLLGIAKATPEQIFNADKAWRKTGVSYQARVDFVPPPGSRIQLLIDREK